LQKNLGRIQAVVIGAVVPHILYMIMGTECDTHLIVVRLVVLFLFETLTLYIYYASPAYGYIGCLSSAFALTSLVYACGPKPSAADEQSFGVASFQKMTQTIMGVLIMTFIDMVLSSERASTTARRELCKGMMAIDAFFQACFYERAPDGGLPEHAVQSMKCRADIASDHEYSRLAISLCHGKRQAGTIMAHVNQAAALGDEANKEPRYQRGVWPTDFFNAQVSALRVLRANLCIAEQVLKGTRRQGVPDYAALGSVTGTAEWDSVKFDVVDTMGNVIEMVQAIMENETNKPLPLIKKKLNDLEGADKLESMGDLFDAINKTGLKYPSDVSISTIEDDEICRLNVLLMLFESNIETVAGMMKQCLKMV